MSCKRIKRVSHGGALPGYGSNYAFFPEYGIGLMAFGNLTYTSPIPYDTIEKLLFEELEIKPRELPASEILLQTQKSLAQIIQQQPLDLDNEIFAENFFLDRSKDKRTKEIQEVLSQAGMIISVNDVSPRNQLRGDFNLLCEQGEISIFFTLTPEHDPKVQRLDISFSEKQEDN